MKNKLKMYGERNTNTNYLERLIDLNLEVEQLRGVVPKRIASLQSLFPGKEFIKDQYFKYTYCRNLGWKHSYVKPGTSRKQCQVLSSNLCFITITKNPYSWLLSLYRNPYHQYYSDDFTFEEFLIRPWKTVGRDNVKSKFVTPIELWNIKNRSYFNLESERALFVTTEQIFVDPEEVISMISNKFEISYKAKSFVNYNRSTKDPQKNTAFYRDYYLNERWASGLSDEAILEINKHVDHELWL